MKSRRVSPAFLHLLFFLSGAAGLGYQLVWTKMFTAGLGHEMPALVAVVSAFFGGLACGGWSLDGRISASPNPRRWYGALELVVGLWGALVSLLIPTINGGALDWMGASSSVWRQGAVAFAVPFVTLLPATLAMGASLPAMERWLAPLSRDGRCLGAVYGVNTLGAVTGTLASVFLLMPALGFRGSSLVLAALSLFCGVAALTLSPSFATVGSLSPIALGLESNRLSSETSAGLFSDRRLRVTVFFTGLLGIGFEIVGTRVLAEVLEGTAYTFAAVLAIFLLGTALGATLCQKSGRGKPFGPLLGKLLAAVAVACLAGVWFLGRAPDCYDWCRSQLGDSTLAVMASEIIVAATVFGLATLGMGATFSHLVQAARRDNGGVGRAAASNTLGGALAGVVFGTLLLPALGAKWTLVAISLGYVLLLPRPVRWNWLAAAWVVAVVFAVREPLQMVRLPPGGKLLDYREGVMASVAVVEEADGHRTLRVNNRFQMGGSAAALAERRQALMPLLLHGHPTRALFLGPGTGITLGAAAAHPGLVSDGVELVPEVIDAMRFFRDWNFDPGRQPNVRLHAADARRFVRAAAARYDVIVADLFHPAQDGAGFLYTREHFQAVRHRLEPGGLFCQWLPLHQLDEPTLRSIIRTFTSTFSETRAFLLHFNVDIPVLGLVGTLDPLRLPADWLERRDADAGWREKLKGAGLERTINLFGCLAAGPEALRRYAGNAALSADDFPSVSFTAPRFTARRGAQPHELLLAFLARCPVEPGDLLAPPSSGETEAFGGHLTDFLAARTLYLRGLVEEGHGSLAPAVDLYLESARRSLYFTPGYARCVTIIQAMAKADPPAARKLFDRLEAAQPAQPLGRKMLGPLFEESR